MVEPSLLTDTTEPLLVPDPTRFTMFPLKHHDLWKAYKQHMSAFWSEDEIDFPADKADWAKLTDDEKTFIEHILAFFAGADGLVIENLIETFSVEVQAPEARAFYAFQAMIENVHCVSGDTRVLTQLGYLSIGELTDRSLYIWTGKRWSSVEFRFTGMDALHRVALKNGMYLDCTADHLWVIDGQPSSVPTRALLPGMTVAPFSYPFVVKPSVTADNGDLMGHDGPRMTHPFVAGFYVGSNLMNVNPTTRLRVPTDAKYIVLLTGASALPAANGVVNVLPRLGACDGMTAPVNAPSLDKLMWLEGLCAAAGVVHSADPDNPLSDLNYVVSFASVYVDLLRDIQLMLTTMRMHSWIEPVTSSMSRLVLGRRDLKPFLMHQRVLPYRDHVCTRKQAMTADEQYTIVGVETLHGGTPHPTFCFTEHDDHRGIFNGIMTNQSTVYSLLIDTFVEDPDRKTELFNAIQTIPCVSKKASWAMKWIDKSKPFAERLIAFVIIEGVFFSGSFCSIFWLKSRGVMTRALGLSNEFIARDEALHTNFGILMYSKLRHRLSRARILEIVREAVEIEQEFICDSLPCALIGMNSALMYQYIQYVADRILVQLGYAKEYNAANPFDFMANIGLTGKTNFFEKRATEYQSAAVTIEQTDKASAFDVDADF